MVSKLDAKLVWKLARSVSVVDVFFGKLKTVVIPMNLKSTRRQRNEKSLQRRVLDAIGTTFDGIFRARGKTSQAVTLAFADTCGILF